LEHIGNNDIIKINGAEMSLLFYKHPTGTINNIKNVYHTGNYVGFSLITNYFQIHIYFDTIKEHIRKITQRKIKKEKSS